MVRTLAKSKTAVRSPLSSSTPHSKRPSAKRRSSLTSRSGTPNNERFQNQSADQTSQVVGAKKRKRKPGRLALKEIKYFQKTTDLLLPRLPFSRVVREIAGNIRNTDYRFSSTAIEALQEMSEQFLIRYFEETQSLAIHAKRLTIMQKDMVLLNRLKYSDHQTR